MRRRNNRKGCKMDCCSIMAHLITLVVILLIFLYDATKERRAIEKLKAKEEIEKLIKSIEERKGQKPC